MNGPNVRPIVPHIKVFDLRKIYKGKGIPEDPWFKSKRRSGENQAVTRSDCLFVFMGYGRFLRQNQP